MPSSDQPQKDRVLLQALREEMRDLKDCFTKFAFQAIAFATAALGLIFRFPGEYPFVALACVALVFLLVLVARIGTYKYEGANRLAGYELHLSRTEYLPDTDNGWRRSMRDVGFQEAMRAWRTVQPTIFEYLYTTSSVRLARLRKMHRHVDERLLWFDLEALISASNVRVKYRPGSYLRMMLTILHTLALISLIPLAMATRTLLQANDPDWWIMAIVGAALTAFVLWRILKDHRHRKLLESGLLSIHACSILWQAVIMLHNRALSQLHDAGWRGYTYYLALYAEELKENIFHIYEYLEGRAKIRVEPVSL